MRFRNAVFTTFLALCPLALGCRPAERDSSTASTPSAEKPDLTKVSPAEKLFRDFEAKILTAKVVRISGNCEGKGKKRDLTFPVSLLSGADNRARMSMSIEIRGEPRDLAIVSDGTKLATLVEDVGIGKQSRPSKNFGRGVRFGFTRLGLLVSATLLSDDVRKGIALSDVAFPVDSFVLLPDETVGNVRAYVLQFGSGPAKQRITMKLWLEAETLRPLKRFWQAGNGDLITETYDDFELDGPVEDDKFQIPD